MVKGWVRTTLIDFPGEIATILFFGGCNMRCPMCHNPALVLQPGTLPDISIESILSYLKGRKGKITGVVLSGGEPCLSPGLLALMEQLHQMGLKIKLDTNGYRPGILEEVLQTGWVQYVAMDIKAPLDKYPLLCGMPSIDTNRIQASIDLIRQYGGLYEFRTTVVPNLLAVEDIADIAIWLSGAKKYILQQFRPQGCLDPDYNHLIPYPTETLLEMQTIAKEHINEVLVRGI